LVAAARGGGIAGRTLMEIPPVALISSIALVADVIA